MTQKKTITYKTFFLTAIIGSLLIVALLSANTLRASRQSSNATDEAVSAVSSFYLEAMADRRAKTITNLINNNFEQMEKAVAFIRDERVGSQEELRNTIGRVRTLLGLTRFALVDSDNIVYTQYTTYTGRSRHEFLSKETISDRIITTVSIYGSSKQLCLVIPVSDLSVMGKPVKACFVQLHIEDIVDLLAFDDQGRTHFAIYSKNGGNLSGTELGPVISDQNLFEAISGIVSEDVLNDNRKNFEDGAEGSMTFASGNTEETLFYVPIEGTGWEMAVLIIESVIRDQFRDISVKNLAATRNQVMLTMLSVLLLASILLFQFRSISRDKLEKEKETSRTFRDMANTDSQTGVRNKHAYSENEKVIDRQIREGALEKLAVVVCDINGLKYVNDTKGHAEGDKLIKDACSLICEYFTRGAVFRVGGDEFVVLLQGEGFDTMNEVIAEFNRRIEENIKHDSVVVSLGYSALGREDQRLRDVFERADKMMYERKKELKSMGARTGR